MEYYELYHHGIKGQKWGVRRYQNADGTLTNAGKKRLYKRDSYGRDTLTIEGGKYNEKLRKKADSYKNATLYNLNKVDSSFNKDKQRYFDANKKNNEHYLSERDKWFRQEGEYKNKDYYQFKDISANKWFESKYSKEEREALKSLKDKIEKAAKNHPLYDKSFKQLKEVHMDEFDKEYTKEINYGEYVVNSIMRDIRLESSKNHSN